MKFVAVFVNRAIFQDLFPQWKREGNDNLDHDLSFASGHGVRAAVTCCMLLGSPFMGLRMIGSSPNFRTPISPTTILGVESAVKRRSIFQEISSLTHE